MILGWPLTFLRHYQISVLVSLEILEECYMASADMQWLFYTGEHIVTHGPLVLFSSENRVDISCKLSLKETICMKFQILISGKNEKKKKKKNSKCCPLKKNLPSMLSISWSLERKLLNKAFTKLLKKFKENKKQNINLHCFCISQVRFEMISMWPWSQESLTREINLPKETLKWKLLYMIGMDSW